LGITKIKKYVINSNKRFKLKNKRGEDTLKIVRRENMNKINCFYYTEDFDMHYFNNGIKYFVNFKFVSGPGGFQRRTLFALSHFIDCQITYLEKYPKTKKVFINILDGFFCF
jgi:hypothetical protein